MNINAKSILSSATGGEYRTLSGMSTEDLRLLQHQVLPRRRAIVRHILGERGA